MTGRHGACGGLRKRIPLAEVGFMTRLPFPSLLKSEG